MTGTKVVHLLKQIPSTFTLLIFQAFPGNLWHTKLNFFFLLYSVFKVFTKKQTVGVSCLNTLHSKDELTYF